MNATDVAAQWGLPPGFQPVRHAIPDVVKEVVREMLGPNEPVIVTLSNEGDTISIVATTQRMFTARTGDLGGAGVTGCKLMEFPWEGITNIVKQQAGPNVKIAIHYKTKDGRTVETGMRAKMGKDAVDNAMPFENEAGTEAFEALNAVWLHKTAIQ